MRLQNDAGILLVFALGKAKTFSGSEDTRKGNNCG